MYIKISKVDIINILIVDVHFTPSVLKTKATLGHCSRTLCSPPTILLDIPSLGNGALNPQAINKLNITLFLDAIYKLLS